MSVDSIIDITIGVETLSGIAHPERFEQLSQRLRHPIPLALAPSVLATRAYCNEQACRDLGETHFWLELLSELGGDLLRLVVAVELILQGKVAQVGDVEQGIQSVKPRVLERIRNELGWAELMLLGKGEASAKEVATVSDIASRKLLAALFLAGDVPEVRAFLAPHIAREFAEELYDEDPKCALQNIAQARRAGTPRYETIDTRGPDHDKVFTVKASVRETSATGSGRSKKEAEKEAARKLLAQLPVPRGSVEKKRVAFDPQRHVVPVDQGPLLSRAEKLLGFPMRDSRLLSIALTHPSRLNEVRHGPPALSNLVFAALGSQVLRVLLRLPVVKDPRRWWGRSVDGFNKVQGHVLSERVLGPYARNAGLLSVIQVGKGQSANLHDSIAMETLQACAAALFLDAGMRLREPRLVDSVLGRRLEEVHLSFRGFGAMMEADGKSLLQEVCQSLGMRPTYEVVSSRGPLHAPSFVCELTLSHGPQSYRFRAEGPSKSSAEQAASRLPLEVISAFSKGTKALAEVIDLDDRAALGFVRMLLSRLLATARQGAPGWNVLARSGVFGADLLTVGTRSEVLNSARTLHELVLRVSPELGEELALLIEKGAARRPPDPREHLIRLSHALADCLDGFDVAGSVALQSTPHFRDLQAVASLSSRPGTLKMERLSGAALRALVAALRGWTFEFTKGFDASVEVLGDRGITLEFLSVVFRELTALGTGPRFELSLERREDIGVMAIRGSNVSNQLDRSRFGTLNALVAGIEASVVEGCVEVSWPCPIASEGNDPWADRVVGRLFDSSVLLAQGLDSVARGAHDLKNVLLAIDGQIENAREHRERRFQHLAAAEQSLLTARAAARQLSSALRPVPAPQYEKFSFSRLMKSFVADLHQRLPKGISLQSLQNSSEVQLVGDAASLHSALENLCKNAIEAQPHGGTLKVEWFHDPSTSEILVEVADSGPGMPPAVLEALASGRQSVSTKSGGNGLGLLSVQRIVSTHGGSLSIKSSGAGTSCTILLNAWTPESVGAPATPLEVVTRGAGNVAP